MTPAETLQAAAERLTALDKAAPGGTWERDYGRGRKPGGAA